MMNFEQLLKNGGIADKVTPLYRTVHMTYRPTNAKDRKAILRGDYPEDFSLFTHFTAAVESEVSIGHVTWMKDPKNPSLIVEFKVYDGERKKGVDFF